MTVYIYLHISRSVCPGGTDDHSTFSSLMSPSSCTISSRLLSCSADMRLSSSSFLCLRQGRQNHSITTLTCFVCSHVSCKCIWIVISVKIETTICCNSYMVTDSSHGSCRWRMISLLFYCRLKMQSHMSTWQWHQCAMNTHHYTPPIKTLWAAICFHWGLSSPPHVLRVYCIYKQLLQ